MKTYKLLFFLYLFCFISNPSTLGQLSSNKLGNFEILEVKEKEVYLKNITTAKIRMDTTLFEDIEFEMVVPRKIRKTQTVISHFFLHTLSFSRRQLIVLIRMEHISFPEMNYLTVDYNSFREIIESNSLNFLFDQYSFLDRRYFGITVYPQNQYYALYVNVKEKNVQAFNSSIQSLAFK